MSDSDADRRRFLLRLAKSAIYTAPVIRTFGVPAELLGQGKSSQHKHAHPAPPPSATSAPAPWDKPPPSSMNP